MSWKKSRFIGMKRSQNYFRKCPNTPIHHVNDGRGRFASSEPPALPHTHDNPAEKEKQSCSIAEPWRFCYLGGQCWSLTGSPPPCLFPEGCGIPSPHPGHAVAGEGCLLSPTGTGPCLLGSLSVMLLNVFWCGRAGGVIGISLLGFYWGGCCGSCLGWSWLWSRGSRTGFSWPRWSYETQGCALGPRQVGWHAEGTGRGRARSWELGKGQRLGAR